MKREPIRIVPLHVPESVRPLTAEAPAAAPPKLTYRGGPLISSVEVFTIFWGEAWQKVPQSSLMTSLNSFFDSILKSALLDQLKEYAVPAYSIGSGQHIGTTVLVTITLGKSITDDQIQKALQEQISTNSAFPKPNANRLYFNYLPPGVPVVQGGSQSCQAFCGYHDAIQNNIFYAVMPYADCQGCLGGLPILDAMTSTSSHELCEAITDPIPGQGWYDDQNGEIGDICAWKTKKIGNFMVQMEWSNKAGACV
jgi:hypothetical protein